MINSTINLSNCDEEPIHIPGQIQSHGFLIAIDNNFVIHYHSTNIGNRLILPTNLLGRNLEEIQSFFEPDVSINQIKKLVKSGFNNGFDKKNPTAVSLNGAPFHMILSASDPYCLLEFEPVVENNGQDMQHMIGHSISEMLADKDLSHLLGNTAYQVKNIIQFDRIMIYRFAQDGHGEVVAEAKNEDLPTLLGLHYPATDIPKQARELYKINLTRLIGDVHSTPAAIITSPRQLNMLDLTHSQLRAVSPIHIQYLKNMKVDSSFSISIICHQELWGLIACHNYSPRYIDFKSRESAKLIGQIFSSALEFRQDQQNQEIFGKYKMGVDSLTKNLLKSGNLKDALTRYDISLIDAVDACGAVLVYENQITTVGRTPGEDQLYKLVEWLKDNIKEHIFFTSCLSEVYPDAAAFEDVACGVMVSVLSQEESSYVIWFKPELIQTVKWAGNPEKPVQVKGNNLSHISPRNSFEEWSQTVAGFSKAWNNEEIKSVTRLREEILFAVNQKATELIMLNEKLKTAYQQLDTFSYTIAHDLKNPLSSVKGYAQLLRMEQFTPDIEHSIDRIIAGAEKMNRMITEILEYSKVGEDELEMVNIEVRPLINDFIRDLGVVYNSANIEFIMGDTPAINGDPIMISQVFTNLLSNAVKYSQNTGSSKICIKGAVHNSEIIYTISDNGLGIDAYQLPKIFDLFQRAENVGDIEGSGVGLAIVKRIMERHKGRILVESTVGVGTSFVLVFRK